MNAIEPLPRLENSSLIAILEPEIKRELPPISHALLQEAKEIAEKLFNEDAAFAYKEINLKCFAALNCSSAASGSTWIAVERIDAFIYWGKLLRLKTFPINPYLKPEQFHAIQKANDSLIEYEGIMTLSSDPKKIRDKMRVQCQETGYCFLPSGWINADGGHYTTLRGRLLKDNRIAFAFLNYGAGAESFHQVVAKGEKKTKYDFVSEEYIIDLDSAKCLQFIERLILLLKDQGPFDTTKREPLINVSNLEVINPIGAMDLYALLPLYGEWHSTQRDNVNRGITLQRAGTCSMTNTRALTRDILLQNPQVSRTNLRRFQFSMKLASIVEAYKSYKKRSKESDFDEKSILFLQDALHELNIRIYKLYPEILTSEELALCQILSEQIQNRIVADKEKNLQVKCEEQIIPGLSLFIPDTKIPQIKNSEVVQFKGTKASSEENDLDISQCSAKVILNRLKHMLECFKAFRFKDQMPPKELHILRHFMQSLPPTSGKQKDSFWDLIPSKEIKKILKRLCQLVKLTRRFSNSDTPSKIYPCEIGLIAYDIAAQLAQRCPELKLKDEFAFTLDPIYEDQYLFADPRTYYTVKRITESFNRRCEGKKKIFGQILGSDPQDPTQCYLLDHVQTLSQRRAWCKKKRGEYEPVDYSRSAMFEDILKQGGAGLSKPYLPKAIYCMVALSCFSHSFAENILPGYSLQTFSNCKRNSLDLFITHNVTSNFIDARRWEIYKKGINESRTQTHFPETPSIKGQVFDCFENSAFYPSDILKYPWGYAYPISFYSTGSRRLDYASFHKKWKEEIKLEKLLDEEFRIIEANPNFQVQEILEWAQYNVDKLSDPLVQVRIFTFLFEYGKIEQSLKDSPNDLPQLCKIFQEKAVDYYLNQNRDFKTFLWIMRVSDYLKYHLILTSKFLSNSEIQKTLDSLKLIDTRALLINKMDDALTFEEKQLIAEHIIHSYLSDAQLQEEDYLTLFKYRTLTKSSKNKRKYFLEDMVNADILLLHNKEIVSAIRDLTPEKLNDLANEILKQKLNITETFVWKLKESSLVDQNNVFLINLQSGKVSKKHVEIQDIYSKIQNDPLVLTLNCGESCRTMVVKNCLNDVIEAISNDRKWILTIKNYSKLQLVVTKAKQLISINNQEAYFLFLSSRRTGRIYDIPSTCKIGEGQYKIWESLNKHQVLLESQQPNQESYFFSFKKGWRTINRSEEDKWFFSDIYLVDLLSPSNKLESEWKTFLSVYEKPECIIVEAKQVSPNNRIITHIRFDRLGLFFECNTIDGKTRLQSCEYPGFYLNAKKSIPQLNGISGIFIIENNKGEVKVLIPALVLEEKTESHAFQSQPTFTSNLISNINYFTYQIDHHQQLVGLSSPDDLYLALIYRGQEDYKKACESLDRTYQHTNNTLLEWSIASNLCDQQNKSPQGGAFDCLFAYRMIIHEREKWTSSIHRDNDKAFKSFKAFITDQYRIYRQSFSSFKHHVNTLPDYLKLSPVHEQLLNAFCQYENKNYDSEHSYNFKIETPLNRSHILLEQINFLKEILINDNEFDGIINRINFIPKVHCAQKAAATPFFRTYAPTKLPKKNLEYDFTRPGQEYVKTYYVSLFQQAISPDSLTRLQFKANLFFLMHNDLKPIQYDNFDLYSTLNYVFNNPDPFRNLPVFPTSKEMFRAVAGKCFALEREKYLQTNSFSNFPFFSPNSNPAETKIHSISEVPNEHLKGQKASFFISKTVESAIKTIPLKVIFDLFFAPPISQPIANHSFPIKETDLKNPTPLEKCLFEEYVKGHSENQVKTKKIYYFKKDKVISELHDVLLRQKSTDSELLEKTRKEMLDFARETPIYASTSSQSDIARALLLLTAQQGKQVEQIELGDIMMSLLKEKTKILTEKNCFLDQKKLANIYAKFLEYCLIQSRLMQIDEALDLIAETYQTQRLDTSTQQRLGTILNKERTYDIYMYPEFAIYEYAAGKMLLPNQVEVLSWIIDKIEGGISAQEIRYNQLLLQFAAGGGKTAVIIPILAQRFAKRGLLPVIINTNELYNIGIQNIPESLKASFRQHMEVLEIDLDYSWDIGKFTLLLKDLKAWKEQEKVLLIRPTTWHAINCAKKVAFIKRNIELANYAEDVLDFFKKSCIKLEDEAHLISDPLQQTIHTYGNTQKIDPIYQKLFMRFYSILTNRDGGMEKVASLIGIAKGSKIEVNESHIQFIQEVLADEVCQETAFENWNKNELREYLLQSSKKRPQWLLNLRKSNPRTASLVVLTRSFIKMHFPYILTLQLAKDYGQSIHEGDLTAAPKHHGEDVTSHFGDPFLKMALTIQMTQQNGIPAEFLSNKLFPTIQAQHNAEKKWIKDSKTPSQVLFDSLFPDRLSTISLEMLTPLQMQSLSLDEKIQKHPVLIWKYLFEFSFPQIAVPMHRVTSTSAEMQAGFMRSIMFTATPGIPEMYSVKIPKDHFRVETSFVAQVIDTILQAKNSKGYLLSDKALTPLDFFQELQRKSPEGFLRFDTLIDRGGLLCDYFPAEVARTYLKVIEAFHQNKSTICFEERNLIVDSNDPAYKRMQLAGSDIVQELKKRGIRYEDLSLFLYLDLSRTTGTDVKRKFKDHAGLTVGKKQTVTQTVQAAMRERLLLWDDAQTISWIMLDALYREINPSGQEFVPRALFAWMIHNEANEIKTKVISRAYQEIRQIIENHVWQKRNDYYPQIEETIILDPYELYEIESFEEDSATVLNLYTQELCNKFGLCAKTDLYEIENRQIQTIIKQTSRLIDKISAPQENHLKTLINQEEHVNIEQTQQIQQQQKAFVNERLCNGFWFKFKMEVYEEKDGLGNDFLSETFLIHNSKSYEYYRFYIKTDPSEELKIKCPPLIIHKDFLAPMQKYTYIDQCKPIKDLLVQVLPDGSYRFLACTKGGLEFYRQEFIKQNENKIQANIKYAIIGFDNHILCSTQNLNENEKTALIDSAALNEMTTYIAFLNGQIKNPIVMAQIVKKYEWTKEDYQMIVQNIYARNISSTPMELSSNTTFEKYCGWTDYLYSSSLPILT